MAFMRFILTSKVIQTDQQHICSLFMDVYLDIDSAPSKYVVWLVLSLEQ